MVTLETLFKRYKLASLLMLEGVLALASIAGSVITSRVRQGAASKQSRVLAGVRK